MRRLRKKERCEQAMRRCLLALPADGDVGKLLRCESAALREIYQAEHELERLQRLRRGDLVPAPITVDVQARG